ncbi:membrane-bound lytic murein transglycosylase A [Malonomonas rubra DSM 5091]|uniref:peptidoglycan lytic exotransglycosylase n=1 Tax=Malonomonas rubra DSM 5091 TaxID=1122189 RepID=A0A1M6ICB2_MALRU|nr:murein transglycosylase A [Malonomonas rubra]SHJ31946.1 membrane-bound lytic murein transglycosylase A [Malonomonas rubra DSM 5091]
MKYKFFIFIIFLFLAACVSKAPPVVIEPELPPVTPPPPQIEIEPLLAVDWHQLDGWNDDDLIEPFKVFEQSCKAIGQREQWREVCELSKQVSPLTSATAKMFFETFFQPYQVRNEDGSFTGMITGYYGPELPGSRIQTDKYRYPLYGQPEDLLIVDLDEIYPELSNYRLRGRVVGNRVVPYFERGEIDNGKNPLAGHEIFWVEDPVELFFLHIQGSGRIRLPDGELVMVNYANQNGHKYRSIGKLLLDRQAMTRDQMSMQNIRSWVNANPQAGRELLAENPSYVFFRELPSDYETPPGSLGIPLTERRSLAVDPRTIPLGAPVFLATSVPGTDKPLQQLMVAQDTGGAIKGRVRADFFWGMGKEAGSIAGRMKQDGQLWLLLPKNSDEQLQSRIESQPSDTGIN